jgi:hypothetical protein
MVPVERNDTPRPLRRDDVFRLLLHARPVFLLRLLLEPGTPPAQLNARPPLRLDTHAAINRFQPDALYLVNSDAAPRLLLLEGQSRADTRDEARTAGILHAAIRQVSEHPSLVSIRLLEVRLKDRARRRRAPAPAGALKFEPTNALLNIDPDTFPFTDPDHWVFAAFSRHVSAEWLAARIRQHRELSLSTPGLGLLAMDRLLLGLAGRARFPHSPECSAALEELMNEATLVTQSPTPGSNLTPEELRELEVTLMLKAVEAVEANRQRRKEDIALRRQNARDRRQNEEERRQNEEERRQNAEERRRSEEVLQRSEEVLQRNEEVLRRIEEERRLNDEERRQNQEERRRIEELLRRIEEVQRRRDDD